MSAPFKYTDDHLVAIRDTPHLLGKIAGKNKLFTLHDEWIRWIWDTNESRALQAHRGAYKTTAMAVGIVRWMLFHPDDRIGIVRKTFTDAAEVVTMVAQMMDQPEIKALFKFAQGVDAKARVKRYGKLRYNFKATVTPEGNVTAHGLDGSLTGTHYDRIWCDDIVTLKDRISRAERERTKEILREILTNIIDPGKPVSITGTPWHKEDAWNIVACPIKKYPYQNCGILSEAEIAQKKKTTTPFLWAANYELELRADETMLFSEPVYAAAPWDFAGGPTVAHLDAAFDGDHYCAMTVMRKRRDGKGYDAIGWVYPGNVKDWIPVVVKYCLAYRVKLIYCETNPDKGYTADRLRQSRINVQDYSENMNKHIKISTFLYSAWTSIYWAEETDPEYLAQVLDYAEGQEPDDAPDSAAALLREEFAEGLPDVTALYTL